MALKVRFSQQVDADNFRLNRTFLVSTCYHKYPFRFKY